MPFGPLAIAGGGLAAPTDAQYVVLALDATLTQERVMAGTANIITITDGGAGGAVTLNTGNLVPLLNQANTWTVGSQIIETAVDTLTALQVVDSAARTALVVDTTNVRVGIGKATPTIGIDLLDDSIFPNLAGGLRMASNPASPASQGGVFAVRHSDATEENVNVFFGFNSAANNLSNFGGGAAGMNAMTQIGFWTAANTTTLVGTQRLVITSVGYIGIGVAAASVSAMLHVQPNATTVPGVIIQGVASQTASLFILRDSIPNIVVDSGDGLAGSEFVFNQGGIDIDFLVKALNTDVIHVDAGGDALELMKHTAGKIGMHNVTPVVQAAHIADPAGGGVIDAQARTAINAILVAVENIGITASV